MAGSDGRGGTPAPGRRPGITGVHSVERFVFTVPSIDDAERFYSTFGLDVRRERERIDLYTFGHPHRWGSVHADGRPKQLQFVSYGIFPDDVGAFRTRIAERGIGCEPHPMSDGAGLWLKDPDGLPVQLVVAPKVTPDAASLPSAVAPVPPGIGAAPARSTVSPVRPRRLSHVLRFTPDVARMVAFCRDVLGLRLSDHSGEIIAFMHGAHGSDHHLVAFAKSHAPGLHHTSWDVGSIDEVGLGSEQMRNGGYTEGWGVGRHVIGSNYFYYVRDPWNSWAEYSFGIDFVPADLDWPAADHPPEDSFYVWGPAVHPEFISNHEAPAGA
jgi:catechol 2,3-dioxygenase-like lactoylglutathione lyase family enzyme